MKRHFLALVACSLALAMVQGAHAIEPPKPPDPGGGESFLAVDFGTGASWSLFVKIEKHGCPELEDWKVNALKRESLPLPGEFPSLPELCPPPVIGARVPGGSEVVSYELVNPLLWHRSCRPMGLAWADSVSSGREVPG